MKNRKKKQHAPNAIEIIVKKEILLNRFNIKENAVY
jgi:hypothetical protein